MSSCIWRYFAVCKLECFSSYSDRHYPARVPNREVQILCKGQWRMGAILWRSLEQQQQYVLKVKWTRMWLRTQPWSSSPTCSLHTIINEVRLLVLLNQFCQLAPVAVLASLCFLTSLFPSGYLRSVCEHRSGFLQMSGLLTLLWVAFLLYFLGHFLLHLQVWSCVCKDQGCFHAFVRLPFKRLLAEQSSDLSKE